MATRIMLTPDSAEYPASNFPQLLLINRRPVLAFDAGAQETAYWTAVVPQGWTGTKTAVISYIMASATADAVDFEVAVESVTAADAVDLDATSSFDSVNSQNGTVPGTAGYLGQITVTLTNNDSSAAGDYVRVSVSRDADDATNDTAVGDCYVLAVEIRDGA